jgi:hypothetical protein
VVWHCSGAAIVQGVHAGTAVREVGDLVMRAMPPCGWRCVFWEGTGVLHVPTAESTAWTAAACCRGGGHPWCRAVTHVAWCPCRILVGLGWGLRVVAVVVGGVPEELCVGRRAVFVHLHTDMIAHGGCGARGARGPWAGHCWQREAVTVGLGTAGYCQEPSRTAVAPSAAAAGAGVSLIQADSPRGPGGRAK